MLETIMHTSSQIQVMARHANLLAMSQTLYCMGAGLLLLWLIQVVEEE